MAPAIGGSSPGPGGVGGQGGVGPGTARLFGTGTPNAIPGDSCIEIFTVGANGVPDNPPGGVDDQLLGTGGTDAAGNFVDTSDASGIPLSQGLRDGERLFAFDACQGLVGTVAGVILPAPTLSLAGLLVTIAILLLGGWWAIDPQTRRPARP